MSIKTPRPSKPVVNVIDRSLTIDFPKVPNRKTPYMVTDLNLVAQNILTFNRVLPDVELFYAVKANNSPEVVKTADSMVTGYDIASLGELMQLIKLGVDPSRVLYSNPVKIPSHIKSAYKLGVRYFAFDSTTEIEKLAKYAPGSNVYLRIKVADFGSKFPLSKKFGVDPMHALDFCSFAHEMGLNVIGVTFHVGSQSENKEVWKSSLEIAGKVMHSLRDRGIEANFLDIGGGFPSDYGQASPDIEGVAKVINDGITEYMPDGVRVVAEPGRFIVANASTMVTSIIGREHRSGSDWLYLDVGTFQGLMEPLEMSDWHYPISSDKPSQTYKKNFILTGPTCDACDTLGDGYLLPSDLNVGDKLYIASTGAYTIVYASSFNGFTPPKQYFVNSKVEA